MDIEIKSISISGNGETQRVTCIVDGKDIEITTPVISEDGLLKEHIEGRMGEDFGKADEAEAVQTAPATDNTQPTTEESNEAASEIDPPADQGDEGTAEQEETTGAEQPEATETEGGESQDA